MFRSLSYAIFFCACSTLGQSPLSLNPNSTYKKNMSVIVNGKSANGMIAVPVDDTYTLDLNFKTKMEVVRIKTCHKEIVYEDYKSNRFFVGAVKQLENVGFCPIEIDALDLAGHNESAIVEFENETLKAAVNCNGEFEKTNGVSVCQSKVGLTQRITFFEKVKGESLTDDCANISGSAYFFEFEMPKSTCVFLFKSEAGKSFHRLTTFGYTDILMKNITPKNQ